MKELRLPEILTLAGFLRTGDPIFAGASAKVSKQPKGDISLTEISNLKQFLHKMYSMERKIFDALADS